MPELICQLEKKYTAALGSMRHHPGLMVAEEAGYLWLRGLPVDAVKNRLMHALPVKASFLLDEQQRLFEPGGATPVAILKELHWMPAAAYLPVEWPVSALPVQPGKVPIRLVRHSNEQKGVALRTSLQYWKAYAETAPAARLSLLAFAVSEKEEALVIGDLLPQLPGNEYWQQEGLLLPAGYGLEAPLLAGLICRLYNPANDAVLLFDKTGRFQRIEKTFFVEGRRSAIRLTTVNQAQKMEDGDPRTP